MSLNGRTSLAAAAVILLGALVIVGAARGQGGGDRAPAPLQQDPVTAGGTWERSGEVVVVDVAGEVARPGVVELPVGSRVRDAITMAGGPAAGADLGRINRAAPLVDGQHVVVPAVGAAAGAGGAVAGQPAAPISLNAADAAQLEQVPGIGPATAAAIIRDREENGPFAGIDEVVRVPGIGPATAARLEGLVTM